MSDTHDELSAAGAGAIGAVLEWLRVPKNLRVLGYMVACGILTAVLVNGLIKWKWGTDGPDAVPWDVRFPVAIAVGMVGVPLVALAIRIVRKLIARADLMSDIELDKRFGPVPGPPNGMSSPPAAADGGRRDRIDPGPAGRLEPVAPGPAVADGITGEVDSDPAVPRPFPVRVRGAGAAGEEAG